MHMSDQNSAYAALIRNIFERDRAKDVEQFDDTMRTFFNEMNKFENRFGKIRDEEKMLEVNKLMPESRLNYRFRGTAMPYCELIIALENIVIDKVSTVPTATSRKHDTGAPTEIGLAAKEDGENASQEGDQRIVEIALQAVHKGTDNEKWSFGKGQSWNEKVAKAARMEERTHGRKAAAREEAQGRREEAKGETRTCWTCGKTGHIAAWCKKGGDFNLYKHGVCWKRVKMSSGER